MKRRPIVIVGPTAGGKSSLAVAVGEGLPGQSRIISADSMQIYRHLDAGTAKPTPAQRETIAHLGIDMVEPGESFTVAHWLEQADRWIEESLSQDHWPIIVGGTNLYLNALLQGLFEGPDPDPALRQELLQQDLPTLHAELKRVDPEAANRIMPGDQPRLVRAIEVFRLTGQPISQWQKQWQDQQDSQPFTGYRHNPILIGLQWTPEAINPRINLRVKAMFTPEKVELELASDVCIGGESLPVEIERLLDTGILGSHTTQANQALGYKQVLSIMPNSPLYQTDPKLVTLDDAFERTKILTRRFAKQQRTWLKRYRGVQWIDPTEHDDVSREALIRIEQAVADA